METSELISSFDEQINQASLNININMGHIDSKPVFPIHRDLLKKRRMAEHHGNVEINGYSQLIIDIEEEKRNKLKEDDSDGNKLIKDKESGKVFKYFCEDCFKGFTHCGDYKKHQRSHTGERPYGCHECTKQFTRKGDLATHISMVHKKERPFLCEVCSKSFSQNSDLLKHSRIHSGEKPYACDFCTKKFARKDHLRKHFYTHTKSFTKNNLF